MRALMRALGTAATARLGRMAGRRAGDAPGEGKRLRAIDWLAPLAAGALAGCATFAGTVDDKGRAYRTTNEAPVAASSAHEPLIAEPSISILDDRIPQWGGRQASAEPASGCEAERWQRLLGMTKAQASDQRLPDAARVVDWGAAVTQDYRPDRLNVQLDQGGRVYRVVCG